MARPTKFTIEQKVEGMRRRVNGETWKDIAKDMGVTRDILLYHCSAGRQEQVQKSVAKYQKKNYKKVRAQQKTYATNLKVQQSNSKETT